MQWDCSLRSPLILVDNPRRVATQARVRIVHASPSAGNVDIYVTAVGADLANETPAFSNVAFKADTGYVDLDAGDYDVTVTPTASKTAAIGPVKLTFANSGIYTVAARDATGGGVPLGVIALDDLAP
jgi:trimeric autotransporter adhesin